MQRTRHLDKRMNQRGITSAMVDLTVEYGSLKQDKYVLSRSEALELRSQKESELRTLMKVIDKGGLVVVEVDNAQLTAYNYGSFTQ